MASSAENSNSFTGPTIPWSSVIPTQWHSISGRVSIVRFSDGASAFCWLVQRWLTPTDYQFTLSLVSPWGFPSFSCFFSCFFFCNLFILLSLFFMSVWLILSFLLIFYPSFFPSFSLIFFYFRPTFFTLFLSSWALSDLSIPLIGRRINQSIHAEKDGKREEKWKMLCPQGFISSEKSREREETFEFIEGSAERGEMVKR